MRGVYIHIPFCSSICSYCDFCKMIYNESWSNDYLKALKKEIEKYYEEDEIKTIYIGGGTPSSLTINDLKYLFDILNKIKLSGNYEFTFEMNVNDITKEKLDFLKTTKVNRISVGVESTNKYKLKFLNRKHNEKEIKEKIKLLKNYYNNINIDFMYALPIESYSILKKDLKKFIKLGVNHISTYSLIIEENTVLKINNIQNINEELDYKMYNYICSKLKNKGYNHYEVSNFSKMGYESKHNLIYWNNEEYYGFGLGAHGYINSVRYENTKNLNSYLNDIYRKEEYIVSKKEEMENEIILGLRKLEGIDIKEFFNKYNLNIQDIFNIKDLIQDKLMMLNGTKLFIPESKIYIMNEILNKIIK